MNKRRLIIAIFILQIIMIFYIIGLSLFIMLIASRVDHVKPNIFGHRFLTIEHNDKYQTFAQNDVVITKSIPLDQLNVGDTIAFISRSAQTYSETAVSKIAEIQTTSGAYYFSIINTEGELEELVSQTDVIGVYRGRFIGGVTYLSRLNTVIGYVIYVAVPFCILAAFTVIRFIMIKTSFIPKRKIKKPVMRKVNSE